MGARFGLKIAACWYLWNVDSQYDQNLLDKFKQSLKLFNFRQCLWFNSCQVENFQIPASKATVNNKMCLKLLTDKKSETQGELTWALFNTWIYCVEILIYGEIIQQQRQLKVLLKVCECDRCRYVGLCRATFFLGGPVRPPSTNRHCKGESLGILCQGLTKD